MGTIHLLPKTPPKVDAGEDAAMSSSFEKRKASHGTTLTQRLGATGSPETPTPSPRSKVTLGKERGASKESDTGVALSSKTAFQRTSPDSGVGSSHETLSIRGTSTEPNLPSFLNGTGFTPRSLGSGDVGSQYSLSNLSPISLSVQGYFNGYATRVTIHPSLPYSYAHSSLSRMSQDQIIVGHAIVPGRGGAYRSTMNFRTGQDYDGVIMGGDWIKACAPCFESGRPFPSDPATLPPEHVWCRGEEWHKLAEFDRVIEDCRDVPISDACPCNPLQLLQLFGWLFIVGAIGGTSYGIHSAVLNNRVRLTIGLSCFLVFQLAVVAVVVSSRYWPSQSQVQDSDE